VLLFPLPVADEIVGKAQFRNLCSEHTVIKVDPEKARGKKVFLREGTIVEVPGMAVSIKRHPWNYADVESKEILLSYEVFYAKGGLLMRSLGISETGAPLIFPGYCGPKNERAVFDELKIVRVERRNVR